MYIPSIYQLKDRSSVLRIIRENPFGILVAGQMATHLPFTLEENTSGEILLTGHLAKANPQTACLDRTCLIIFQGPHGYISPQWYERANSVPTWDYLAVHCYGTPEILPPESHWEVVEKLIRQMEPDFLPAWHRLPTDYKNGLSRGITAFTIKVERMEAAAKLSQDRTLSEKRNIVSRLMKSPRETDRLLANWIDRLIQHDE